MSKVIQKKLDINTVFGYNPTEFQTSVHRLRRLYKYLVLVAHRRFGKTELGIEELSAGALTCNKRLPTFGYLAPTLKQAKNIAWEKMQYFWEEARRNGITNVTISKTNTQIKVHRGGDIGVATIELAGWEEPESLRGPYWDGVVVDEAADQKPGVWGKIIAPRLADRNGWAIITGTVKGLDQFYDFYQKGLDSKMDAWGSIMFDIESTRGKIPWLSEQALNDLRQGVTDIEWDQEMNCNWNASSENILIPLKIIETAAGRNLKPESWVNSSHILGVDVAGYGEDPFCIARRWGAWYAETTSIRAIEPKMLASRIILMVNEHKIDGVVVDGTGGFAGGLMEALTNMGCPCPVYEINFKSKATDEVHFANIRAEMWYKMSEHLKQSGGLENDIELKRDLSAPSFKYANGRMILEPKEDIRKKLGRSPDKGDAYALTHAINIMPFNLQSYESSANIHNMAINEFTL